MKKIAITLFFTGLLLFCVYGAISYSSVRVDNPASLEIVNSDSNSLFATNSDGNGLISINASGDYYSIEQGGLAEGVLVVSNKLESGIDFTFECDSDYFTFIDDYGYGYLDSYGVSYISMSVDENCPAGEHLLTVFLNAEFPGGSARLKNDLLVEVYEPVPETDEKAGTGTGTGAGDDGDQTGSEDKNAASKTATGNGTATGEGTDAAEGTVSGNDDEMGTGVGTGDGTDDKGETGSGGEGDQSEKTGTGDETNTGDVEME